MKNIANSNLNPKEKFMEKFNYMLHDYFVDIEMCDLKNPKKAIKMVNKFIGALWDDSKGNMAQPHFIEVIEGVLSLKWFRPEELMNLSVIFYPKFNSIEITYGSEFKIDHSGLFNYLNISRFKDYSIESSIAWRKNVSSDDRKKFISRITKKKNFGNLNPFKPMFLQAIDDVVKKLNTYHYSLGEVLVDNDKYSLETFPPFKFYKEVLGERMDFISETLYFERGERPTEEDMDKISSYIDKKVRTFFKPFIPESKAVA